MNTLSEGAEMSAHYQVVPNLLMRSVKDHDWHRVIAIKFWWDTQSEQTVVDAVVELSSNLRGPTGLYDFRWEREV
jgi:hypothetical protein